MGCQPAWFVIIECNKLLVLSNTGTGSHFILTSGSIFSAVEQVHKLFAAQCSRDVHSGIPNPLETAVSELNWLQIIHSK